MYIWLNSTKSRGVWGHAPENFEKLNPLRVNLRALLTSQDSMHIAKQLLEFNLAYFRAF